MQMRQATSTAVAVLVAVRCSFLPSFTCNMNFDCSTNDITPRCVLDMQHARHQRNVSPHLNVSAVQLKVSEMLEEDGLR